MSDVALRFGAKDDGLKAEIVRVRKDLEAFRAQTSAIAGNIRNTFNSVKGFAGTVLLGAAAREALEFAEAQKNLRQQTGLSNDEAQRLSFIADQASVSTQQLATNVGRLQRILGGFEEGAESSQKALKRLGLANAEFYNQSPAEQYTSVAKAVAGLANENKRALAVQELFGRGGAEQIPLMKSLAEEAGKLEAKFDSLGGPVGQKAIDRVEELGDELSATALAGKSLVTTFLDLIAPPVIAGLEQIQKIFTGLRILGGGGGNASANITQQVEVLQAEMRAAIALASARAGVNRDQVIADITKRFQAQINDLLRQQDLLHQVGVEGSKLVGQDKGKPAVAIPETEEERAKRLKAEEEARLQRIQHIATMHQIEQDLAYQNSLVLAGIDQKRLDDEVARTTKAAGEKLRIQTAAQAFLADVRKVFGLEEIKFEQIKDQSILEIASGMFSALARENSKLAKIQQGIALAQTIWSTASGIMKAFELPWPASIIAAGKVALTGAIQVAKIKSTNYSPGSVSGTAPSLSGGSTVGAASSPTESEAPELAGATGATTVYISGVVTHDVVDALLAGLRDGFDRDVVLIPQNSRQAQLIREG